MKKKLKDTIMSEAFVKFIEALAESTALFDAQITPWQKPEMQTQQTSGKVQIQIVLQEQTSSD